MYGKELEKSSGSQDGKPELFVQIFTLFRNNIRFSQKRDRRSRVRHGPCDGQAS